MINKVYAGDIGTVIDIDVYENISGSTNYKYLVKKPDDSEVEWAAVLHNTTTFRYTTEEGDIDVKMPGAYYINPYATIGSWTGVGDTVILYVLPRYG
jgi:hypothetical protein